MSFNDLIDSLNRNVAMRLGAYDADSLCVISASYGNDSVALIQWAYENGYHNSHVVFVDTGWSGSGWIGRVSECEDWVRQLGFVVHRIAPPVQFQNLMIIKKGFPNQRYQWCSAMLKGIPFLSWVDEFDPDCKAVVMIGKRRDESAERADTPEWVIGSDYHGGRIVRHPLYLHSEAQRNEILLRAGFGPLPYRSQECAPCVNANRGDFLQLTEVEIARVEWLEHETGQTMFRPKRHMGATGIREVIEWAKSSKGKFRKGGDGFSACSSGYCGH